MIHELIINGKSTREFKLFLLDADVAKGAERDYQTIEVAGRSGDLHIDNGRFRNVRISYKLFADGDAKKRINAFNAFLMSISGYARIEDSFNPEIYRMGEFTGGLEPKFGTFHRSGIFDVVFDCKPQKWLKSGSESILISSTTVMENPTLFPSLPKLKITGTVLLMVGNTPITVLENSQNDLVVDSELLDVYGEQTLLNYSEKVQMPNGFPLIASGESGIMPADGMSVEIIPRWWTV